MISEGPKDPNLSRRDSYVIKSVLGLIKGTGRLGPTLGSLHDVSGLGTGRETDVTGQGKRPVHGRKSRIRLGVPFLFNLYSYLSFHPEKRIYSIFEISIVQFLHPSLSKVSRNVHPGMSIPESTETNTDNRTTLIIITS